MIKYMPMPVLILSWGGYAMLNELPESELMGGCCIAGAVALLICAGMHRLEASRG